MKKLLLTASMLFSLNNFSYSQGNNVFITDNMNITENNTILHHNLYKVIESEKSIINKKITTKKLFNKTENNNDKQTQMVFPNPANDYINITTNNNSKICICTSKGEIIKTFDNVFGESFIDIRDLPKGIYLVKIYTPESKVITEKLKIE